MKDRLRDISVFLFLLVPAVPVSAEPLVLDADSIPPDVATSREAVSAVAGGLRFRDGGLKLESKGRLSAGSGGVGVLCRLPEVWPAEGDATLFHAGDRSHEHVTLFVRGGVLLAVYKADVDHYVSLRLPCDGWEPKSQHAIEYSWKDMDAQHVQLILRVDDRLVGTQSAPRLARWPASFSVGGRGRPGTAWPGIVTRATISPNPLPVPEFEPGRWQITVDGGRPVGTMYNFWSIDNFTSEDMFADPAQQERIAQFHPYMKYVNTVRLLGGRSDGKNVFFLGVDDRGEPICDFRLLKDYIGGMLEWGYTPRLVLDNVPNAMSRTGEFNTYGNTDPPKDYRLWAKYVERALRALVDEFGLETVRTWRIRVGTEPDLYPGHWSGTREEYFEHYDWTVDAVLRVIPDADVGPGNILNPATEGPTSHGRPRWGLDILEHAAEGRNHVTGERGTRLRHFSCSWYGQVGRPIDSFDTAIERMRAAVDHYPQFRDIPLEVAEFSVLTDDQGRRMSGGETSEWGASWYAAITDRVYRHNVAQVHNWGGMWFDLRYARTNVMEMLTRMAGGDRLACHAEGTSKAKCGAVACRQGERLLVMLYNHRPMRRPKVAENVTLTLSDPRMADRSDWELSRWQVDEHHGTFIHALHADCEAAGLKPNPDVPEFAGSGEILGRYGREARQVYHRNRRKYAALSQLPKTKDAQPITARDGRIELVMELPGHSVWLLELRPR